jgi:hypothetical protein
MHINIIMNDDHSFFSSSSGLSANFSKASRGCTYQLRLYFVKKDAHILHKPLLHKDILDQTLRSTRTQSTTLSSSVYWLGRLELFGSFVFLMQRLPMTLVCELRQSIRREDDWFEVCCGV